MIIITGASRGIGNFLFQQFCLEGETVIGTYNSTKPNTDCSQNMMKLDITDEKQVHQWVKGLNSKLTKITLINCAGVNYNSYAHKADIGQWTNVINVNLIGTFLMINAVLPIMREENYGRIINFSSVVAQAGVPGTSAYAASKSALWGLTKSIAVENAKKGITINNLNLGYFDIGMIGQVPNEHLKKIKNLIPSEKLGSPVIIFNTIKFLMENDYVNGTSVDINGGLF
jgi:NAD(P)-dependent dehydrogenase (short-subunit alcohol dehydrogenase family)